MMLYLLQLKKIKVAFFIYGSGGYGKTYLWKAIITKIRSDEKIVLPLASSGIAATLLPGSRSEHSNFKIPLKLFQDSTCFISHNSNIAEQIKQTNIIIWDEAPMQHIYRFEALDRSLRDVMKVVSLSIFNNRLYLVIDKGGRSGIVKACISH